MKAIIDACSLISLTRYYLPFDFDGKLNDFLQSQYIEGNIIYLDKVVEECKFAARGLAYKELNLTNIRSAKTDNLFVDTTFQGLLNSKYTNFNVTKKLTPQEIQVSKNKFLNSADIKLILYSMKSINDYYIVTEESVLENDNKIFKKIPTICKDLNIKCIDLPKYLLENIPNINIKLH